MNKKRNSKPNLVSGPLPSKTGDWRTRAKLMEANPRFRKGAAGKGGANSDTENPEEGGIYPASSEPEWALKESKLKGIFKKTKIPVHIKNSHKAPLNRVIDTTEDEEYDGYGRS
jgi:hypothetical protein